MSDRFDEYMEQVQEKVLKHGWMLQGVFPRKGEPGSPFTYTVGLTPQYHHPELIVFGLPYQIVASILNDLGSRIRDGLVLHGGDRLDDVLQKKMVVEMVTCHEQEAREHLTVAGRFNNGPVRALQMAWPDKDNLLPWQEGYSLHPELQPVLGEPLSSPGSRPNDA